VVSIAGGRRRLSLRCWRSKDKPIRTRNAANRKGRGHKDYPVALQAHVHALDEAGYQMQGDGQPSVRRPSPEGEILLGESFADGTKG
jgi:hypothetical protein